MTRFFQKVTTDLFVSHGSYLVTIFSLPHLAKKLSEKVLQQFSAGYDLVVTFSLSFFEKSSYRKLLVFKQLYVL
jgi:hypothetical protein